MHTVVAIAIALGCALNGPGTALGQGFAELFPGGACDPKISSCIPGAGGGGPSSCGPGNGGATCGGSGPASQGSSSSINLGAGNPVNVINGNKYQREVDMPALPGVLGLEIVRHYNSAYSGHTIPTGILGRGWRLSYETALHTVGRTVQIIQADGTRIIFNRSATDSSQCASANPAHGKVVVDRTSRGDEYAWTWPNGRKLSFDSRGKLVQILAPTGEFVSLQHDARGMLLRVTDPQGRSLHLNYLDKEIAKNGDRFRGVQSIDSPAGRFSYSYGSEPPKGATIEKIHLLANLVRIVFPKDGNAGASRHYHYEDARRPTLLTGITVDGSGSGGMTVHQRIVTWAYDIDGKTILSVKGDPLRKGKDGSGIEQVTFDRTEPGRTIVTNSLGQSTVYKHATIGGEYRLLEIRGPGCASCGETNVKYDYDKLGRLTGTTQLNEQGQPIQSAKTELDDYGRRLKISRINYSNGKPQPAQWLVRYSYHGDQPQPVLIARPSIVPHKEAMTRIAYNDFGQPISIAESGWSPAADGTSREAAIERITAYRYTSVNGRSLLAEIDGPLPNGQSNSPADSDITHAEWDDRGNAVTAMITPGNFKSTVEYDELGRISQVSDTQGRKTTLTYDARNRLIVTYTDGITQKILYDAFGNPLETGYDDGNAYKALARFGFDNAGRNVWRASHLGILQRSRYDTEGKLLEAVTQTASFRQTRQYAYDASGRLIASADAAGGVRRVKWNSQGLPSATIDALGRETRYRYDAESHLIDMTQAANTEASRLHSTTTRFEHDVLGNTEAVIAPNGAATRYGHDDFGRTTAIISADSGTVRRSYDAANRLVASADANGNRATYEYDVTGRIARQTVIDAKAVDPAMKQIVTVWQYEGKQLVAVEHPDQTERYRHDEQGWIIAKTVTLKLADGSHATSVTRYQYDALGQLDSVNLPDGSAIRYKRNGQNQIIALERSRIQTPWLSWLLPTEIIVKGLERDFAGVKSYTYGNGIQALWQRSQEGSLARIVYRNPNNGATRPPQNAALDALFGIANAHAAPHGKRADAEEKSKIALKAPLPGALALAPDPQALIDHRYLWDAAGNLLHAQGKGAANSYAYDVQDRLIGAAMMHAGDPGPALQASARYARYFYDGAGNRVLAQEGITSQSDTKTNTVKASYAPFSNRWSESNQSRYDATGQPTTLGKREYVWDALGKLIEVRQGNRALAQYRYNHRGERIAKTASAQNTYYLYEGRKLTAELDNRGRIVRQYMYLADQPIAVIDTPHGTALETEGRTLPERIATDIVTAFSAWFASHEEVAYLHANHLGATEMVSDHEGKPLWKATYSPYGKIIRTNVQSQADGSNTRAFKLHLRLPGQYEDEETALYYNDHRYYDPERGQYLTPDPLGLRGGINRYSYVRGNPLKYIDPSGLILFAFDGTNNSNPPPGVDDFSNVYKFYQAYDETQNGRAWYMNGVGRDDPDSDI